MGRRGPKPLPTAVKSARGTLQPCRTNPDEPRIVPTMPEVPAGFDAAERKRWDRWCELLVGLGVLSQDNGPALEQLVQAETRLRRARRLVRENGSVEVNAKTGLSVRSAWARELDAAESAFRAWCAHFGVTPSARTSVKATGAKPSVPTERDAQRKRFFGGAASAS